jgi:hypothetical protein
MPWAQVQNNVLLALECVMTRAYAICLTRIMLMDRNGVLHKPISSLACNLSYVCIQTNTLRTSQGLLVMHA